MKKNINITITTIIILLFSVAIQAKSLLQEIGCYENYNHDKTSLYKKYEIKKPPEFMAKFTFVGEQLSADYNSAILIDKFLLSPQKYLFASKRIATPIANLVLAAGENACRLEDGRIYNRAVLEKLLSDQYKDYLGIYYDYIKDGYSAFPKDYNLVIVVCINPQKAKNYQKAINYAYNNLFNCQFDSDMVEVIKNIHIRIAKSVEKYSGVNYFGGKYRNQPIVILPGDGSRELLEHAKKYYSKNQYSIVSADTPLDPSDKKVQLAAKNHLGLTLGYKYIEDQMKQFALDLMLGMKLVDNEELSPVALAAWAHCKIGFIHPFSNGNGRIARIIVNAILMHYGYAPVIFDNDVEYVAAMNKNIINKGVFSEYLAQQIVWSNLQFENKENALDL